MIDPDLWQTTLPFANSFGPKNARIAIVGDVWGQQETLAQVPFIGSGGQELSRMLKEVEIERGGCFLTTVLPLQPERGDVETLCVNKAASVASGKVYPMPPLRMGKYVHPNLLGEVQRLKEELVALQPNLIIAVGYCPMCAGARFEGASYLPPQRCLAKLVFTDDCADGLAES